MMQLIVGVQDTHALYQPNCDELALQPSTALTHPSLQEGMLLSVGLLRAVPYRY
jgi:hypothetical protein